MSLPPLPLLLVLMVVLDWWCVVEQHGCPEPVLLLLPSHFDVLSKPKIKISTCNKIKHKT
jgi:hypothetical protein